MNAELATELLERQPDVESSFLVEHRGELLQAVVAPSTVDAVRAAILRDLQRIEPDATARAAVCERVVAALRSYGDDLGGGDPLALMIRHPAWVGLCWLLVTRLRGEGDPRALALHHARAGFRAAVDGPTDAGEVFWAMAESADEAGWVALADELLAWSHAAPFGSEDAQDQVSLLHASRLVATDPDDAAAILASLEERDEVAHPIRVQAGFVRSRILEARGQYAQAEAALQRARDVAAEAGDDDVVRAIDDELRGLERQ